MKKIVLFAAIIAPFVFGSCNDTTQKTSNPVEAIAQEAPPARPNVTGPIYPKMDIQTDDSILKKTPRSTHAKLIKIARDMDKDKKLKPIRHSDEYHSKEVVFNANGKKYRFMIDLDEGDLAHINIVCTTKDNERFNWMIFPDSSFLIKDFVYSNKIIQLFHDGTECPVIKEDKGMCNSVPMKEGNKQIYAAKKKEVEEYNQQCIEYVLHKYKM